MLYKKSLELFIGDEAITIDDLDDEVGKPRRAHVVNGCVLFTSMEKEGKTKVSSTSLINVLVPRLANSVSFRCFI